MSHELKVSLMSHGLYASRTFPYHTTGNGLCEIWKTIMLTLKAKEYSR